MDFMTTSTPSPAKRPVCRRGFTLVEVLISAALMGFLLMGILTTFLFLGRSSANIVNYAEMEGEARKGLETFAVDTRQASELTWVTANTIDLVVGGVTVRYGYDTSTKSFYKTANGVTTKLITNVSAFEFRGFQVNSTTPVDVSDLTTVAKRALASNVTKQIQISMKAERKTMTAIGVTNSVFSARYILRNKKVTS